MKRTASVILAALLFAGAASAAPRAGEIETGMAAGLSGTSASLSWGLAGSGKADLLANLELGMPWSVPAPFGELGIGLSMAPWRSKVRAGALAFGGLAMVPGTSLVAPYGGCAVGLDIPLGASGVAIRAETLARFGGREFPVAVVNPLWTTRSVDSWAPAAIDLRVGLRWKPLR